MASAVNDLSLNDAHAHLDAHDAVADLALRSRRSILTCFSTATPEEWARAKSLLAEVERSEQPGDLFLSFGIHPWESAHFDPDAAWEAYAECAAVGEIGLDKVWCDVPLARQSAVLEAQLQIASDLHKPIVLHTKGAEARIASMVEGFPEPVLVHWYSGPLDAFEQLAEQGCFFTLGPDCAATSSLSHTLMTQLPLNRLLAETDGIDSVRWALEQKPQLASELDRFTTKGSTLAEAALKASICALARSRNIPPHDAATLLRTNMRAFYGLSVSTC